ncbi:nSTAND1 domain-containing NTPase [Nonomuraea rubra]
MTENPRHDGLVASALVRILDREGIVTGFGLYVAPGKVVTCAHVVAMSFGEPATLESPAGRRRVRLDFPFLAPGLVFTAKIVAWRPLAADGTGDVAGLETDDEEPPGAHAVAMARGGDVSGHAVLAYGYQNPHDGAVPAWVPGRIVGRTEQGWLQLGISPSTGGLRIRQGFSGSPVWDLQSGQVVGLVNQVHRGRDVWLAYAISGDAVFDTWAGLRDSFRRACPYRSLMPFEPADAALFFGRDDLTASTVDDILSGDVCLISGASGAGKTSLVKAGVTPVLQERGFAVLVIRPSVRDTLWQALAAAAVRGQEGEAAMGWHEEQKLAAAFAAANSLVARISSLLDYMGARRLVVVVDQFEELLRDAARDGGDFLRDLRQLTSVRHAQGGPLARVVLVVRDDLRQEVLELPGYAAAIGKMVRVGPLSDKELRAAVEGPVRATGFARFEDGLTDRIIDDVRTQPYCLPALQIVLTHLWERQTADGLLRHGEYLAVVSASGAIASYLEQVWEVELGDSEREAACRLFLHLVVPLPEDSFARRLAFRDELDDEEWRNVGVLATHRVVVLTGLSSGAAAVELVHDALIDQWPSLRRHLSVHRDFLVWRDDIRRRIAAWEQTGRHSGQHLTGAALNRALDWQRAYGALLSPAEAKFLAGGQRRRRSIRRRLLTVIVIVLVAVTATGGIIVRQQATVRDERNATRTQQAIATARGLLTRADALRGNRPAAALAVSLAAYRILGNAETSFSLARELLNSPFAGRLPGAGLVSSASFSFDGRLLATVTGGARLTVWDVTHAGHPRMAALPPGHSHLVTVIAFKPHSSVLAGLGKDGSLVLWDVKNVRAVKRVAVIPGPAGDFASLAFSTDGTYAATSNWNARTIAIRDSRAAARWPVVATLKIAGRSSESVAQMAFRPGSTILAVGTTKGRVVLFDVRDPSRPREIGRFRAGSGVLGALEFSPDGRTMATTVNTGVDLWTVDGTPRRTVQLPTGQGVMANSLAFSPEGDMIAAATEEDITYVWQKSPLGEWRQAHALVDNGRVATVAFNPDGSTLVTAASPGTVNQGTTTLWHIRSPFARRRLTTVPVQERAPASWFALDGRYLITSGWETSELWNIGDPAKPRKMASLNSLNVDFGPPGMLVSDDDGLIRLWRIVDSRRIEHVRVLARDAQEFIFLDDQSIAVVYDDGIIELIDLTDLARPTRKLRLAGDINGGWEEPGRRVITVLDSHDTLSLWDATDLDHVRKVGSLGGDVSMSWFSDDGRYVATFQANSEIRLWDVRNLARPQLIGNFGGGEATDLVFNPDDRTIALVRPGTTSLWDVSQPNAVRMLSVLPDAGSTVSGADFDDDGNLFVTLGVDKRLAVWDVTDRTAPRRLLDGDDKAAGLAFSPDGAILAVDGEERTTTLWDFAAVAAVVADPAGHACAALGHGLTRAEWAVYVPEHPYRETC